MTCDNESYEAPETFFSDNEQNEFNNWDFLDSDDEKNEEMDHPYSLEWFKTNREEQYDCAFKIFEILKTQKNIIVDAEEKSGKRVICEILALLTKNRNIQHVFFTSLNRLDIIPQFEEQQKYNIICERISSEKIAKEASECIETILKKNSDKNIIVHFDECDYGTGYKQSMGKCWKYIMSKHPRILKVLYSATPEEASYELKKYPNKWKIIIFKPSNLYCGAEWYLRNNKVHDAESFFDYNKNLEINGFSDQGRQCLKILKKKWKEKGKNIGIIRLTKNIKNPNETIKKKITLFNQIQTWVKKYKKNLNKKLISCRFISGKNNFNWSNTSGSAGFSNEWIHLIFICQTCTRSTEVHNDLKRKVAFWHDNRKLIKNGKKTNSCYNTLSQAFGRIKFYDTGEDVDIDLYADRLVFELNSGRKTFEDTNIKLSSRIKSINKKINPNDVKIKRFKSWNNLLNHREKLYGHEKLKEKRYNRNIQMHNEKDKEKSQFIVSNIRGVKKIRSYQEVKDEKMWGMNEDYRIRHCVAYLNLNDPSKKSKRYVLKWFLGVEQNTTLYKTQKSIYN